MPDSKRARCVACGYAVEEDLRVSGHDLVCDTGRRIFQRCEVCQTATTHRVEEVRVNAR